MKTVIALLVAAMLIAQPLGAQQPPQKQQQSPPQSQQQAEEFSFYGLRFGMSPEQVREVFRTNESATEAIDPRHGMMYLVFTYDFRGRLSEIRASYERPADRLREYGLRQALKDKFIQPTTSRWRGVSADIDESFNRAALTLVLISLDQRQEALEYFKEEYLLKMK
jgi:hypothetical protein